MEVYPSDLSDEEWDILAPLIPPEKAGGRPRTVDMRAGQSTDLLRVASWLRLAHAAPRVSAALHGLWLCAPHFAMKESGNRS